MRELEPDRVQALADIADAFLHVELLPANEAYRDSARQELDAEVLRALNLPDTVLEPLAPKFRRKWCNEPSVHGGKSTRLELAGSTRPLPIAT